MYMKIYKLSAIIILLLVFQPFLYSDAAQKKHSKKLSVGILQDPPFTYRDADGKWTGIDVYLWKEIARELDLDYEYRVLTPEKIMKALGEGTIDLTIAAVHITTEREKKADFSIPFGTSRVALATIPEKFDHPWTEALKIFFSWGMIKVVGSLVVILLVAGIIFWLIERKHNPEHFGDNGVKGIGAGVYWVSSTLASGNCNGVILKSVYGRVAGIFWMLVCSLALSAFVASLASSLTARTFTEKIVDLQSLRGMDLGTVRHDVADGIVKKIGGRYSLYETEEESLNALINEKIDGFLFDEVTLHYHADRAYRGKISVSATDMKRIPYAFGFPQNSPLRKKINIAMLKIMDEPIWEAILKYYGLGQNMESIEHVFKPRMLR